MDPSGLLYMRARWYDPGTGGFLARDPLAGDVAAPRTLNAYGYAGANPTTRRDPSGLRFTSDDPGGCLQHCVDVAPPDLKRLLILEEFQADPILFAFWAIALISAFDLPSQVRVVAPVVAVETVATQAVV